MFGYSWISCEIKFVLVSFFWTWQFSFHRTISKNMVWILKCNFVMEKNYMKWFENKSLFHEIFYFWIRRFLEWIFTEWWREKCFGYVIYDCFTKYDNLSVSLCRWNQSSNNLLDFQIDFDELLFSRVWIRQMNDVFSNYWSNIHQTKLIRNISYFHLK